MAGVQVTYAAKCAEEFRAAPEHRPQGQRGAGASSRWVQAVGVRRLPRVTHALAEGLLSVDTGASTDPPCFLLRWLGQACALCRDTEGLWASPNHRKAPRAALL